MSDVVPEKCAPTKHNYKQVDGPPTKSGATIYCSNCGDSKQVALMAPATQNNIQVHNSKLQNFPSVPAVERPQ